MDHTDILNEPDRIEDGDLIEAPTGPDEWLVGRVEDAERGTVEFGEGYASVDLSACRLHTKESAL